MRGFKLLVLLVMLMTVAACAPVAHYSGQTQTPSRVAIHSNNNTQSPQIYLPNRQQIHPIEVTLFADRTYRGARFQPINLVIANNQYVEIPIKNRRGQYKTIYAHYHHNDLHFDVDRNCRSLIGSSRYKYDNRWEKGYRYNNINAGKDYDLSGLQLQIRNVHVGKQQVRQNVPVKVVNKKYDNRTQNHSDHYIKDSQDKNHKVLVSKTIKRPVIVEKIKRQEESKRVVNAENAIRKSIERKFSFQNQPVKVVLSGGTITLDGKQGKLRKKILTLKDGESRNVTLIAKGGVKVNVPLSYHNGLLSVASSGHQFKRDTSWREGKTFNVSTHGDSRLNNVQVSVVTL